MSVPRPAVPLAPARRTRCAHRALPRLPGVTLLAAVTLAACGGGGAALPSDAAGAQLPLDAVDVVPGSVSVAAGATLPLTVSTIDAQGRAVTGATLAFASADTLVARVEGGAVRGVAAGTTQLTVTARKDTVVRSRTVPVTVSATGGVGGAANEVTTSGTSFVPASITIAVGSGVTWRIAGATHNVTFGGAKPAEGDVPNLASGQSAVRTFPVAGTFPYQCTLHSGMAGTVVVQGGAAPVFTTLAVSPATPGVTVGGTVTLVATPRDQNGSAMAGLPGASWTTSSDAVARVTTGGVVSGVGAGTATITASVTSAGVTRSGTATVTVTAPSASNVTVTTPSLTFAPQTVTVASGSIVTWQMSGSTHNVTFGALAPAGGSIGDTDEGNAVSRTFTAPGTYDYRCTRHDGMTGRVIVSGDGTGTGGGTGDGTTPPAATVRTTATAFTPEEVAVPPGSTVRWEIAGATHNITFKDDAPPGGNVPDTPAGASVTRTFPSAGSYDYECTLHPGMRGRIRVR